MPGLQRLAWYDERQKRCSFKLFDMFTSGFSCAPFLIQNSGAYPSLALLSLRFCLQTREKYRAWLTLLILNFSSYIRQLCFSLSLQLLRMRLWTVVFLGTIVSAGVGRDGVWTRFARCVSQSALLDGMRMSSFSPSLLLSSSPIHSIWWLWPVQMIS